MDQKDIDAVMADFVYAMARHKNKGKLIIDKYVMENRAYMTGNDQGHWPHNVIYLKCRWTPRFCYIMLSWTSGRYDIRGGSNIRKLLVKCCFNRLKQVVSQIP